MKNMSPLFAALAAWLLPTIAIAHTGAGVETGWWSGFAHPFAGADHVLAMVAVGLWAAQLGGRATWWVPGAFVAAMMLGGALAVVGVTMPWVEQGIAASVLVLGLLIATRRRLPLLASTLLVGGFALFHGHAHGAEMPIALSALTYVAGFALATALLHGGGIALALVLRRPRVMRLVGVMVAAGGAVMALS